VQQPVSRRLYRSCMDVSALYKRLFLFGRLPCVVSPYPY